MKFMRKMPILVSSAMLMLIFSSCVLFEDLADRALGSLFDAIFSDNESTSTKTASTKKTEKKPLKKAPTYRFHEELEFLPLGTNGTAGPNATYAYFGDWPQTAASSDVTVDEGNHKSWGFGESYYVGSDGNCYVPCEKSCQFYKIEPIKWRVIEGDEQGKIMLVSEKILACGESFYDGSGERKIGGKIIHENNYKESRIRAWLNGLEYKRKYEDDKKLTTVTDFDGDGFLQAAFTLRAQRLIAVTKVDNSSESTDFYKTSQTSRIDVEYLTEHPDFYNKPNFSNGTKNEYACEDTKDCIFLLGISESLSGRNDFLGMKREVTDFASANGASSRYPSWMLRSPWSNQDTSCVYSDGIYKTEDGKSSDHGIVPALNISVGKKKAAKYKFHDKPEYLPKGTDGSCGKNAEYAYFGDWPQTIKPKKVKVDESNWTFMGNMICFSGSDGNYYVKCREDRSENSGSYKYSDGTEVGKGDECSVLYFKVEPIKWRVAKTGDAGEKLLIAESVIDARAFLAAPEHSKPGKRIVYDSIVWKDMDVYPNNYKESEIRAYLNGQSFFNVDYNDYDEGSGLYKTITDTTNRERGFLQTAFSKDARNFIATTDVDNSAEGIRFTQFRFSPIESNIYACGNTRDKIFLLSVDEATSEELGFVLENKKTFLRPATDYAKAKDVWLFDGKDTTWQLRDPRCRDYGNGTGEWTMHVNDPNSPEPLIYDTDYSSKQGIVPALTLVAGNPNANPNYSFHENIEYLPKGTDGSGGKDATYLYFGDWPQTIKSDYVGINEKKSINVGSNVYYAGSDGNYYFKSTEKLYRWAHDGDIKYSNGNSVRTGGVQYFRVEPIKWRVINTDESGKKLLLCENVLMGEKFLSIDDRDNDGEAEPIENGIRTINGKKVYPNNYKESGLRAFLNGYEYMGVFKTEDNNTYYAQTDSQYKNKGFLEMAFTKKAQSKIVPTKLSNVVQTMYPYWVDGKYYLYDFKDDEYLKDAEYRKYEFEDIEDKIFILSANEAASMEYGFDYAHTQDNIESMSTFIRSPSDYAKSRGVWVFNGADSAHSEDAETFSIYGKVFNKSDYKEFLSKEGAPWALRSPWTRLPCYGNRDFHFSFVGLGGHPEDVISGWEVYLEVGVVPAMTIVE